MLTVELGRSARHTRAAHLTTPTLSRRATPDASFSPPVFSHHLGVEMGVWEGERIVDDYVTGVVVPAALDAVGKCALDRAAVPYTVASLWDEVCGVVENALITAASHTPPTTVSNACEDKGRAAEWVPPKRLSPDNTSRRLMAPTTPPPVTSASGPPSRRAPRRWSPNGTQNTVSSLGMTKVIGVTRSGANVASAPSSPRSVRKEVGTNSKPGTATSIAAPKMPLRPSTGASASSARRPSRATQFGRPASTKERDVAQSAWRRVTNRLAESGSELPLVVVVGVEPIVARPPSGTPIPSPEVTVYTVSPSQKKHVDREVPIVFPSPPPISTSQQRERGKNAETPHTSRPVPSVGMQQSFVRPFTTPTMDIAITPSRGVRVVKQEGTKNAFLRTL